MTDPTPRNRDFARPVSGPGSTSSLPLRTLSRSGSHRNSSLPLGPRPSSAGRSTDDPRLGMTKRKTLDMEEGTGSRTSMSLGVRPLDTIESGEGSNGATSASAGTGEDSTVVSNNMPNSPYQEGVGEKATMSRRTLGKDESGVGLGLGGHAPPRRMTMRSDLGARSFHDLFTPEHRLKPSPSSWQSLKNIFFASPFNILLVCIPISWALYFALDRTTDTPELCNANLSNNIGIFLTAFLGIMPLAQLLSYGTEELSLRVGQTLGGLINATLGNAVELIVAIIALFHCELTITQTSLVGSVLSNLLLVLGTCFFVGGLRRQEQEFKQTAAQLNSGLLAMAVIALLIPAAFHATLGPDIQDPKERGDLLKVSRGTSVILLITYGGYLFFTLFSHRVLYEDDEPDEAEPTLSVPMACGLLAGSTALVGVTSEWLVDSINGVTCTGGLSKTWVGLILLPIVSNAAEHWSAVSGASKNKMDLAMGIAVGSSIQISIFVVPLLVIISWIADKPLSLVLDPFIAILLFLAVLIVNYAISDGRSNYMEGWVLIMVFLINAIVAWFVNPDDQSQLFPDSVCH